MAGELMGEAQTEVLVGPIVVCVVGVMIVAATIVQAQERVLPLVIPVSTQRAFYAVSVCALQLAVAVDRHSRQTIVVDSVDLSVETHSEQFVRAPAARTN